VNLSFNEKFEKLTTHITSRLTPENITPKYLYHYICDFIELYTFFYKDRLTKSAIIDLFDDAGFNLASLSEKNLSSLDQSEKDNLKESSVDEIFNILQYRKSLNDFEYAFDIDDVAIVLKENLSFKQKLYLVLLFASNLSIFIEYQSDITSEFEAISYYAIKDFFPQATVKQFGKNSDYTGNAKTKIKALAKDMNMSIDEPEINKIPTPNSQERGLDIIAWIAFSDKYTNMLTYLIQCAAGKDWINKFSEVYRYDSYFHFKKLSPSGIMMIPYSLNINGDYEQSDDIISSKALLLDRLRILEVIKNESELESQQFVSITLVEKLLEKDIQL